ncbi:MAG: hypothetical protein GX637_06660, partial [Clostridiales bacterium]|nr:hypothetical protein [Clostridiales bacterium]
MLILTLGVVFLSLTGWFCFLRARYGIKTELLPVFTFSCVGFAMFLAGILNLLPHLAWLITLAGVALLARCLWRDRSELFQKAALASFWLPTLSFFALCFAGAWYFQGKMILSCDNYTHWGLIAKNLVMHDRLPNFENAELFLFPYYQPGSAVFIYYLCEFIGLSDGKMLLGQGMLLLACLWPLTGFVRRRRLYALPLIGVAGAFLLTCNIQITELLVDTLLPLLAGAAFYAVFAYRDEPEKGMLCAAPILWYLLTIKNSAPVFYAAALAVLLYALHRQGRLRARWKAVAILYIAVPLLSELLWKRHVSFTYADADASLHAFSLSSWLNNLRMKQTLGMSFSAFAREFLQKLLVWNNPVFLLLSFLLALTAVLALLTRNRGETRACLRLIGFCAAFYLCFLAGLLGMYVFSMHFSEGLALNGFERYHQSCVIFLYYVVLVRALSVPAGPRARRRTPETALCACALAGLTAFTLLPQPQVDPTPREALRAVREHMEPIASEYAIPPGKQTLVYLSDL